MDLSNDEIRVKKDDSTSTEIEVLERHEEIQLRHLDPNPMASIERSKYFQETQSKAFEKSAFMRNPLFLFDFNS